MFDAQVLAFAGVALVLTVTPGPDMALVLRNSIRGGRPAAYRTVLGIAVGLLVWAAATALGVAAVLSASATVFTALKLAGGAYLVANLVGLVARSARFRRAVEALSGAVLVALGARLALDRP